MFEKEGKKKLVTIGIAFLNALVVALIAAIIGGAIVASPEQISHKLSVAFYAVGSLSAQRLSNTLEGKIALAIVGAIGGVAGWGIYSVTVTLLG